MLGNDAMKFLKTLHILDEIWNEVEDAEYNDRQLTKFAERYHQHKLKLLGIHNVVGQSEQLVSFLRQYQKTCEIMHVNKIEAKNFVEQYKTN